MNILPNNTLFTADPEKSWTIPGNYYFDRDIYDQEIASIFHRNWQYMCHGSLLSEPGQYFVRDIGDQSIFLVKDQQGEIRGYHNVCQHRAHRLLEGAGKIRDRITCPYHAWCYELTGELQFARGSDQVLDFPKDKIRLQPVRVDSLCGFYFVSLNSETKPIAELYTGLEEEILAIAPDAANLKRAYSKEFNLAANWKNSMENYSECYHCPNRHPSLVNSALDIDQYRIEVRGEYHRHITTDVGDSQGYKIDASEGPQEFGSWMMWPNMVFEVYPGGNLTIFNHVPTGPESTRQETEWFFSNDTPSEQEQEVIDFVNVVREEDIPICESVQRGLHSYGYHQGRFIVDKDRTYMSEHAVHDFQLKVMRALHPSAPNKEANPERHRP